MTGTQGHTWTRNPESPHTRAPVERVSGRDVPTPSLRPCPLPDWLHNIRTRSVTINTTGGTPTLRGAAVTQHDLDMSAHYTHALHLAAQGTHPTWWTYASGRDRIRYGWGL